MLRAYLKLGIPVLVTCIIASAGLAATYAVTKDRIAAQDRIAKEKSLKIVLPQARTFVPLTDAAASKMATTAAGETPVYGVYSALDGAGSQVGWGILVGPRGYGGPISMAVGVDGGGKVTGVAIVSMNETPGLGTKVLTEKTFLPGFAGIDVSQGPDTAAKVDTIQGATKSSRGVRHGVEAAANIYAQALAGLGGGSGQ
jgi:electron transport complex protein RnfG